MEILKRTEELGFGSTTSYAVITGSHTTILRVNSQNDSQIEMNHLAGRQVGAGYKPAEKEEVLKRVSQVHDLTGKLIHDMISRETATCECGKVIDVEDAHFGDDGTVTCPECLESFLLNPTI